MRTCRHFPSGNLCLSTEIFSSHNFFNNFLPCFLCSASGIPVCGTSWVAPLIFFTFLYISSFYLLFCLVEISSALSFNHSHSVNTVTSAILFLNLQTFLCSLFVPIIASCSCFRDAKFSLLSTRVFRKCNTAIH